MLTPRAPDRSGRRREDLVADERCGPDPGPDAGPDADPFAGALDGLITAEPGPGHGTPADRTWAVLAHLSIVPLAIAFPLVVVLSKGESSPYIGHQAVEALNFQTTVLLAVLACTLTAAATVGLLLLPVVVVGAVGLSVRAARCAHRGAWHRYPCTLRPRVLTDAGGAAPRSAGAGAAGVQGASARPRFGRRRLR
jgi:hypothetical protein